MKISEKNYVLMKSLIKEYDLNLTEKTDVPYMKELIIEIHKSYNPHYGDDRICECGHAYYRHFDSYDDNANIGCKYCQCHNFKESV